MLRRHFPSSLLSVAGLLGAVLGAHGPSVQAQSVLESLGQQPIAGDKTGELQVEVVEAQAKAERPAALPARVVITAADGSHPDGSGRGAYADGRFFADGRFTVALPAGPATVRITCGPHVVPLDEKVSVLAGQRLLLRARMQRWFAPTALGWYAGDNHVHTQHDAQATVRTDPAYTALQGRANGLSFITEADGGIGPDQAARLDTSSFLYRTAPELRPGPFVGHLNTPGVAGPIPAARYQELVRRPLPRQALHEAVRGLGGAMIHTHPLAPPHLLHWMGATEAWSDAVLGRSADLLDIDSPASEQLWFAMLNLGNRIGCSGSTDCALGRLHTLSPGDRRVYCKADKLDYGLIVEAMRRGRTVATNGGPLFADMTLGGKAIGEVVQVPAAGRLALHVECHSLLPLRTVQVYHGGRRVKGYDVTGRTGRVVIDDELALAADRAGWCLVRAENQRGDWALTSPVYLEPPEPRRPPAEPAAALLLEVGNHTRFIQLRRQFFAHLLVTVRPPEAIEEVRLMRDGDPVKRFRPGEGDQWHERRVPVTGLEGDYGPGWAWQREGQAACHLQADWPVDQSGWYALQATTSTGRTLRSHAVRFDGGNPNSHALSAAHLEGPGTRLSLVGYGEELALSEVREPFVGDHWWYPRHTFWRLRARFQGEEREVKGGANAGAAELFRDPEAQ